MDQRVAIAEVVEGRLMGDAGEAGHAADGHRIGATLLDQVDPGLDAGGTQVAVVVRDRRRLQRVGR